LFAMRRVTQVAIRSWDTEFILWLEEINSALERRDLNTVFHKAVSLLSALDLEEAIPIKEEDESEEDFRARQRKYIVDVMMKFDEQSQLQGNNQDDVSLLREVFGYILGDSIGSLLDTVNRTRDEANSRNLKFNIEDILKDVDNLRLKGFNLSDLPYILAGGFYPYALLGAEADMIGLTPSGVSVEFSEEWDESNDLDITQWINGSRAKGYSSGIVAIIEKDKEEYQAGHDYERNYPFGLPLEQVRAFVLTEDIEQEEQERLDSIKIMIATTGVYIPLVDIKGHILFTREEFDRIKYSFDKERLDLQENDNVAFILTKLKRSELFGRLMELDAGVSEGLTIEQHTNVVGELFEKYFKGKLEKSGVTSLSDYDFRLLLALHDIGKGVSIIFTDDKGRQHEYTVRIVRRLLLDLDIEPHKAKTILALIDQDIIGEYLQGKRDKSYVSERIHDMAQELEITQEELFNILKIMYMCDAGSYTTIAMKQVGLQGKSGGLDHLFIFMDGEMSLAESPGNRLQELESKLKI